MKYLLTTTLLLFSFLAKADQLGSFGAVSSDFKSLFNSHRYAMPDKKPWAGSFFPYKTHGISDTTIPFQNNLAPSLKYDQFWGTGQQTYVWERQNHSCDYLTDYSQKKDCEAWWGHCNAWSAAAVLEDEPVNSITAYSEATGSNHTFSVADQKAWLTELWMNSDSLFLGHTNKMTKTGAWVLNPYAHESMQMVNGQVNTYTAFWEVTPRAHFLMFTNMMGAAGRGLVIDRFTGNEVWNQPVTGYRFLPIRNIDIHPPIISGGRYIYSLTLRQKVYWLSDNVWAGTVTSEFTEEDLLGPERDGLEERSSLAVIDEQPLPGNYHPLSKEWEPHFDGRSIQFKLFFDAPIKVDATGTKILQAGNLVGDGIWHHQEDPNHYLQLANSWGWYGNEAWEVFNHTHFDFIWAPTVLTKSGIGNPFISENGVKKILNSASASEPEQPTDPEEEPEEEDEPADPEEPTDPEEEDEEEPADPEEDNDDIISGPGFTHATYDVVLMNFAAKLVANGNSTEAQVKKAAVKTLMHIMQINGKKLFIKPNEIIVKGKDIKMRLYTNVFLKIRLKNILKSNGLLVRIYKI